MNELALFCKNLKEGFTPKIKDAAKPVRFWSEKDVLDGKIVDAFVIIFRTRGCSWALKSGCTMCGYFNDSMFGKVDGKDLLKQFDTAMKDYSGEKIVKIFNSGSFLDDCEINSSVRSKILTELAKKSDKVSIESRPEYITDDNLLEIKDIFKSKLFEIGIGLETADDYLRKNTINKGFTFSNYKKSAKLIKKYDFDLKTYLLIKPPFLTEEESINDSISTVSKIKQYTDVISFNPVNIQKNTLVEYLWKRRQYRPAWLWSIVEILKENKKISKDIRIKSDVVGGGSIRGAHNCRICDKNILKAIESFSLSQDIKVFDNLYCECKEKWHDQIDMEYLSFGSLVDFSGRYQ